MVVTSVTQEFIGPVAPARLFKALILNSNDLIPKLVPQFIKSIDLLQGDGGAGSIEQVNFTESSHFKYVKHRINELDKENYVCKYTAIEGDSLGDKLESIDYEIKFEPSDNGGCVCTMTSKYRAIGEHEVQEEEIKAGKESAMGIYKIVETYLLENPNVYV
ncbi:pathogenesis-related protein sth-2 [Phtheirospermum japonicum]|uniref:Pathogenesis-related protein sth-2 n=1 Tax=Phtheirospermum japonicum TaxID=374723 RepID=A0A830CZ31_9LAMI|nr:pathogenesis-related protein sth-2 [Phtheirospermum japonicum]